MTPPYSGTSVVTDNPILVDRYALIRFARRVRDDSTQPVLVAAAEEALDRVEGWS